MLLETSPDKGLQPGTLAWGRIASVARTIEWVVATPDRVGRAHFVAPACGRLVDEVLGAEVLEKHVREPLQQVRGLLEALPQTTLEERLGVLQTARGALASVVPESQWGLKGIAPKAVGRLVIPQGQDPAPEPPPPAPVPNLAGREAQTPTRDRGRGERRPPSGGPSEAAAGTSEGPARQAPRPTAPAESGAGPDLEASADAAGGGSLVAPMTAPAEEGALPAAGDSTMVPAVDDLALGEADGEVDEDEGDDEDVRPQGSFLHGAELGPGSLEHVTGFDPTLRERLERAGVTGIAALLLTRPVRFARPAAFEVGLTGPVLVRGKLQWHRRRLGPAGPVAWEARVLTRDGQAVDLVWPAARPRGFQGWRFELEVGFVGEATSEDSGRVVMRSPEPLGTDGRGSGLLGEYALAEVSGAELREAVALVLERVGPHLLDVVPSELVHDQKLLPLVEALRDLHFPANSAGRGRVRLAFEELLLLQLGLALHAARQRSGRAPQHTIDHTALGSMQVQHGSVLDDGHEAAFSDVRRDLVRARPMTRLVLSDSGLQGAWVGLWSAVLAAGGRSQVAMVFADPRVAERRFMFAEPLLKSVGIVALWSHGVPTPAQVDALQRGEASLLFGTREILGASVTWKRLGLVVVEVSEAADVVGPADLPGQGQRPHLLVTCAVPLPPAVAFTAFRDFELSLVETVASAGHATVKVLGSEERTEMLEHTRELLQRFRQLLIVFPLRDGNDILSAEESRRLAEVLEREAYPGARIAIWNSQMLKDDRMAVYDQFVHRGIDVLVCTSPIEDVPPVERVGAIVVEHAEHHALTRLHRLRAHAGSTGKVYLMTSPQADAEAKARLDQFVLESDGFRVADLELARRGTAPSDLLPPFRFTEPAADRDWVLRARELAFKMVREDPGMRRVFELGRATLHRWGDWLGLGEELLERPPAGAGRSGGGRRRKRRRRGR